MMGMGFLLINVDEYRSAFTYFDNILKVNPRSSRAFENRGICYFNLGLYKQATYDFEKAILYDPSLEEKLKPFMVR